MVNLLVYTPFLLVWIIGLVLAGVLYSHQQAVAVLVLGACLRALFTGVTGGLLTTSLPYPYSAWSRSATQLGLIFGVVGLQPQFAAGRRSGHAAGR